MIDGHKKAVLQFSGGKDSTAMLYLARPWLDRIEVVFAETGATFPHVVEFIHETANRLGVTLITIGADEPLDEYHTRMGLPSDIIPQWNDPTGTWLRRATDDFRLQSPVQCCAARNWLPFQKYVKDNGHTLVLRGSKNSDSRVGVPDGHVEDGVEYRSPLWDWSHADVLAYLEREGVTLPKHYQDGVIDSLDCWSCTAHLPYHGREKIAWMRANTPDLLERLKPRLNYVHRAVATASLETSAVIRSALEE